MASTKGPALFGERFSFQSEYQLVMKENWLTQAGGFDVKNLQGDVMLKVKHFNTGHHFFDAYDNPIGTVKRKLFGTMRHTFHIYSGLDLDERQATMNLRASIRKKCHVYVYEPPFAHKEDPTNIDSMKPAIKMKASTFGPCIRDVKIYDADTDEVYATMNKAVAKELLDKPSCTTYVLTVQPRVDYAFMVMLAVFFNSVVKQE